MHNDNSLILPESRAKVTNGVIYGKGAGMAEAHNWVPVHCANCGKPYGYVLEATCTFACWLCDPCSSKYGAEFAPLLMPDEVFWRKVHQEMVDVYGRVLTDEEIQVLVDTQINPLTTLLTGGN